MSFPGVPLVRFGSTRRGFLQAGIAGLAGSSLNTTVSAATVQQLAGAQVKSVIFIWLSGGISQIDSWDPKPDAPREIRGPFGTISTKVNGISLCEHLPRMAAMMDKLAIIRSMDASASNHTPTTFQAANSKSRRVGEVSDKDGGGYPSLGSAVAHFRGPNQPGMPAFVALADSMKADIYGAGHLGHQYEPMNGMAAASQFGLPAGISPARLSERNNLRQQLDLLRARIDSQPQFAIQDRHAQLAFEMVHSQKVAAAFDLNQEENAVKEKYGSDSFGTKTLMARRLVEAGVSFVTLSDAWGHWDHHGDNVQWGGIEKGMKPMLPRLDFAVTNLITDLEQRGLLDSTMVIVTGEFGRGPVINNQAGRDHWTPVMSLLLAGGGISGGQVIGQTDSRGGQILQRKLEPENLAATVYQKLGINPATHWVDPSGRPIPLVEGDIRPIEELM